jgi:hypothetical protein
MLSISFHGKECGQQAAIDSLKSKASHWGGAEGVALHPNKPFYAPALNGPLVLSEMKWPILGNESLVKLRF